jgi:hypothetical protein
MMTARFRALLCAMIVCGGIQLLAPDLTLADPTASPPAPPPPHKVVVPDGFHILKVGDVSVMCQPSDDAWVTTAVGSVKPTTRPSTMPSDILSALQTRRGALTQTIMSDMALTDQKPIDEMFDKTIIATLGQMETLKPPIYYFVVSRKQLADLMDKGWEDPHYHYIRFANDVEYNGNIALSIDTPMEDMVLWMEVHDDDTSATRSDMLVRAISDFNLRMAVAISSLSQQGTMRTFEQFIKDNVTNPLKLPPAEQWFGNSVAMVYGIKYTTILTGGSRDNIMTAVVTGDPRNPIRPMPLNLLQPLDPAEMIPENRHFYNDAAVSKGAYVIGLWVRAGGEGVVAKALPTLRLIPINGPQDLIKDIKDSTGVDLSPAMQPFTQ